MSDPDLERMSKEQKDIRLQIENCKYPEKNKQLRKSRKQILEEMNQKVGDVREKEQKTSQEKYKMPKMTPERLKQKKLFT